MRSDRDSWEAFSRNFPLWPLHVEKETTAELPEVGNAKKRSKSKEVSPPKKRRALTGERLVYVDNQAKEKSTELRREQSEDSDTIVVEVRRKVVEVSDDEDAHLTQEAEDNVRDDESVTDGTEIVEIGAGSDAIRHSPAVHDATWLRSRPLIGKYSGYLPDISNHSDTKLKTGDLGICVFSTWPWFILGRTLFGDLRLFFWAQSDPHQGSVEFWNEKTCPNVRGDFCNHHVLSCRDIGEQLSPWS